MRATGSNESKGTVSGGTGKLNVRNEKSEGVVSDKDLEEVPL